MLSLEDLVAEADAASEGEVGHTTIVSLCAPPIGTSGGKQSRRVAHRAYAHTHFCPATRQNMARYAACHGYGTRYLDRSLNSSRAVMWHKIPLLLSVIRQAAVAFVFWHDADSLFARLDTSLDALLPNPAQHLTISGDRSCWLNSGHMMLRAEGWAAWLLRSAWEVYPPPEPQGWAEQSALIYLLQGRIPECRERVHPSKRCCGAVAASGAGLPPELSLRAQRAMNEYLLVRRHVAANLSLEALVVHFPGGSTGAVPKEVSIRRWAEWVRRRWDEDPRKYSRTAMLGDTARLLCQHSHSIGQPALSAEQDEEYTAQRPARGHARHSAVGDIR